MEYKSHSAGNLRHIEAENGLSCTFSTILAQEIAMLFGQVLRIGGKELSKRTRKRGRLLGPLTFMFCMIGQPALAVKKVIAEEW